MCCVFLYEVGCFRLFILHERNAPKPDMMSDSGGRGRMEGGSDKEDVNSDTHSDIIETMKPMNKEKRKRE